MLVTDAWAGPRHGAGSTGAVLLAGDAVYELQQVQRACPSSFLLDDTLSKGTSLGLRNRQTPITRLGAASQSPT